MDTLIDLFNDHKSDRRWAVKDRYSPVLWGLRWVQGWLLPVQKG